MITLVILGIIAAIAYPSYLNQVTKLRRADGVASLERAALFMEDWRADNLTYVGAGAAAGFPGNSEHGYYTIATSLVTATAFTLIATPGGTQARDAMCTALTLNSQGTRGYTGTAPAADTCWGR
jgi:type IV pilus assembly protein PilE